MHDNINLKYLKKERKKNFLKNEKKMKVSTHLVQQSIWRGDLDNLNMNT